MRSKETKNREDEGKEEKEELNRVKEREEFRSRRREIRDEAHVAASDVEADAEHWMDEEKGKEREKEEREWE